MYSVNRKEKECHSKVNFVLTISLARGGEDPGAETSIEQWISRDQGKSYIDSPDKIFIFLCQGDSRKKHSTVEMWTCPEDKMSSFKGFPCPQSKKLAYIVNEYIVKEWSETKIKICLSYITRNDGLAQQRLDRYKDKLIDFQINAFVV